MSKEKVITLIIIILIVIIVLQVGAFFVWKYLWQSKKTLPEGETIGSSRDEALHGWKTYIDQECEYEIRYPPNYSITIETSTSEESGIIITERNEDSREFRLACYKEEYLKSEDVTFEDYVDFIEKEIFQEAGEFEREEVVVNGKKGIQITLKDWASRSATYGIEKYRFSSTSWVDNGNIYSFLGTYFVEDDFPKFLEIYHQILSTWKPIETEKIKKEIYINEKYGFRIELPLNCIAEEGEEENIISFGIPNNRPYLAMKIFNNPRNYDLENFYNFYGSPENREISKEETKGIVSNYSENSLKSESIDIQGITGIKFYPKYAPGVVISLPYNGEVFEIIEFAKSSEEKEIFNQMLSTLKFVRD